MSLNDLVDQLIKETSQQPARLPGSLPPPCSVAQSKAEGDNSAGDSLAYLIDKVSAEQTAVESVANPAALIQLRSQISILQQRTRDQERELISKEERINKINQQYSSLKEKSYTLVVEYKKLRESIQLGTSHSPGSSLKVNTPVPALAAPVVEWKRHITLVQDSITKSELALATGMLKILLDASESLNAQMTVRLHLMAQMATVYRLSERNEEAQQFLDKATALMDCNERRVIGAAYCLDALAQCHQDKDNYEEAERALREAVIIADECLGGEHPEALFFRERLDNMRQQRQTFEVGADEKTLYDLLNDEHNALIAAGQSTTPEVSPAEAVAELMFEKFMANAMNALAQRNAREAESYLRSAMEKAAGLAHNDTRKCSAMRLLGATLESQSKDAEAKTYYEAALKLAYKYLGPGDIQVAQCLESLASVHTRLGEYGLAKNYYRHAINSWKNCEGADEQSIEALETKFEQLMQIIQEDRKWKNWSE